MRDGESDYVIATGRIEQRAATWLGNGTYFFSADHFCWAGWIEDKTSDLIDSVIPTVVQVHEALNALQGGSADRNGKSKQDLDTVRVSVLGNSLYLITTSPKVIVAQLPIHDRGLSVSGDSRSGNIINLSRYFSCRAHIGKAIDADTAKAWRALDLAPETKGSNTCGG